MEYLILNINSMKFIWYNLILSGPINWIMAPIAYLFRKHALKNKGLLWNFLSTNEYGDPNWRPKLKNKHLRAILWMYRNPLQNYYWKDYVDGEESDFHGDGKVKFGDDILSWRTVICSDTGDWHGKVIDFEKSRFGTQNITFNRIGKIGLFQRCYRKSTCIPYKVGPWIVLVKRRSGHEHGLLQYNFSFPLFKYNLCKDGWKLWKETKWKTINI